MSDPGLKTLIKHASPIPGPAVATLVVVVFLIAGFGSVLAMHDAIGVQESTVEESELFESITLEGSTLVVEFSEPAGSEDISEIYAVGPDGTVISRSEVLPRQTVQELDITQSDGVGVTKGSYTVVGIDESGDVVTEATLRLAMGDWI